MGNNEISLYLLEEKDGRWFLTYHPNSDLLKARNKAGARIAQLAEFLDFFGGPALVLTDVANKGHPILAGEHYWEPKSDEKTHPDWVKVDREPNSPLEVPIPLVFLGGTVWVLLWNPFR